MNKNKSFLDEFIIIVNRDLDELKERYNDIKNWYDLEKFKVLLFIIFSNIKSFSNKLNIIDKKYLEELYKNEELVNQLNEFNKPVSNSEYLNIKQFITTSLEYFKENIYNG